MLWQNLCCDIFTKIMCKMFPLPWVFTGGYECWPKSISEDLSRILSFFAWLGARQIASGRSQTGCRLGRSRVRSAPSSPLINKGNHWRNSSLFSPWDGRSMRCPVSKLRLLWIECSLRLMNPMSLWQSLLPQIPPQNVGSGYRTFATEPACGMWSCDVSFGKRGTKGI